MESCETLTTLLERLKGTPCPGWVGRSTASVQVDFQPQGRFEADIPASLIRSPSRTAISDKRGARDGTRVSQLGQHHPLRGEGPTSRRTAREALDDREGPLIRR